MFFFFRNRANTVVLSSTDVRVAVDTRPCKLRVLSLHVRKPAVYVPVSCVVSCIVSQW